MLEVYLAAILSIDSELHHAQKSILTALLSIGGANGKFYGTPDTLAKASGYKRRRTIDVLSNLVDLGLVLRTPAAEDATIQKKHGWVYELNMSAIFALAGSQGSCEGAFSAPSTVQGLHGAENAPSLTTLVQNPENTKESAQCNSYTVHSLHPSRSTTYSTTTGGSVGSGDPSRVREATADLPTKPSPKSEQGQGADRGVTATADAVPDQAFKAAGTRRAEDEADLTAIADAVVASLPLLDEPLLRASMRQNRHHLVAILDCFKLDREASGAWIAYKAADLWARLGSSLQEPAVSKLLAKDAESEASSWMSGRHKGRRAAPARRKPSKRPAVAEVFSAPEAAEQATPGREPVAVGELVRELVPQVAAPVVRREPQVAAQAVSWQRLCQRLTADAERLVKPADELALLLIATILSGARAIQEPGRLMVQRGQLAPHDVATLERQAELWGGALAELASEEAGEDITVYWEGRAMRRPSAADASPALEERPVRRAAPASPLPPWWGLLLTDLTERARRYAGRADGAQMAALLRDLVVALKDARRAVWTPEAQVLTVELDQLGALASRSSVVCAALAHAVALQLDLPEPPTIALVDLSSGEEVGL